jgi:uncharacterized oxidoreductase
MLNIMNLTGNTVLITGGGTGIGRALAIALHRRGNRVLVAGRRTAPLQALARDRPGIEWHSLDLTDAECIRRFVARLEHRWPELNVLVNNAGIMVLESPAAPDPAASASVVATNLLGPITLTSLLVPRLRERPNAAIVNVTSALAFVPLAIAPTYSATKAGLHVYTDAIRILLSDTGIRVIEIAPPRVATEMDGPASTDSVDADAFASEVLTALAADPDATEIVVEAARMLRHAEREGRYDAVLAAVNSTIEAKDML